MISSASGPSDTFRSFANTSSSEGGAGMGSEQSFPQAIQVSKEELIGSLNPLHYVPVVGMIYRAATGETVPTPMRVAGAGLIGGPSSMLGAAFMALFEQLIKMGPDTSRPSAPAGMTATGSEQGMQPVTPGTLQGGAYTTLATTTPDFLQGISTVGIAASQPADTTQTTSSTPAAASNPPAGVAVYQQASMEWQRSQAVEKGLT